MRVIHSIDVLVVGLSTIEAVPVYHFMPGSRALRVVLKPSASLECNVENVDVCEWSRGPRVYPGFSVDISRLAMLAERWACEVVFLEGVEPLAEASRVLSRNLFEKPLCARSQGLLETPLPPWLECLLIEDLSLVAERSTRPEVAEFLLEEAARRGVHVEVAVYARGLEDLESHWSIRAASRVKAPLHLVLVDARGASRRLYDRLRQANPYTYIHSETLYELDTYCEHCGLILAQRTRYSLLSLAGRDACPRCGSPLPFRGHPGAGWKRGVLRASRGKPVWFNQLAFRLLEEGLRAGRRSETESHLERSPG